VTLDDAAARPRLIASLRAVLGVLGRCAPGSRTLELDGVSALFVPSVPERSVMNSVAYDDTAALLRALPELAAAYDEAGITAWTVWAPSDDRDALAELERAGHVLDATPEAMWRPVDGIERPPSDVLTDWTDAAEPAEVAAVNDQAYPFEGDPWTRAMSDPPPGAFYSYLARVDGEPASTLMTHDHDGDCVIWAVATTPEARGRGLVTELMGHALADARERGCDITTLEATKMGQPVYERLGYRGIGALEMWERRRS
jgi:ribosomal protein S18 acetylase RimI-like enzyme